MSRIHTIEFDYEVEALGQSVTVTATVRLAPPGHGHPGDPENDEELEIKSVTLNGQDVNPDVIMVSRLKVMPPHPNSTGCKLKIEWVPEWFLLADLIRQAAWERAEREAA